jgi:hypothetical protein
MAYIKFSPDLLLGVSELKRWKEFFDDAGFRKNILDNSCFLWFNKKSLSLIHHLTMVR